MSTWNTDELPTPAITRLTPAAKIDMLANRMSAFEARAHMHEVEIGDLEQRVRAMARKSAARLALSHKSKRAWRIQVLRM